MTTGFKDDKGNFRPTSGSKGSVSEKDLNVSVKGNNDVIKVQIPPNEHWTKKAEYNKIISVDAHDIKMIAHNRGSHFFDPASMRFFDSRLAGTGYKLNGDLYFITSEQFHDQSHHGERKYTIRVMRKNSDRGIEDIGGFQKYGDSASAKRELTKILEAELKNVAYVN